MYRRGGRKGGRGERTKKDGKTEGRDGEGMIRARVK